MSIKTQITLTDEQYAFLKRESKRTGAPMSARIRQLVDADMGGDSRLHRRTKSLSEAVEATAGLWKDRVPSTEEYLASIRRPVGWDRDGD